jgi:putative nucleotidyltransferase with HDIG domain
MEKNIIILILLLIICSLVYLILRERKKYKTTRLSSLESFIDLSEKVVSGIPQAGQELINVLRKAMVEQKIPLSAIFDISKGFISQMNLKELLDLIVDVTLKIMNAEICSLMLLNDEKSELRIYSSRGLTDDIINNTVIKVGEGISGYVAKTGKPLFIEDISKEKKFKRTDNPIYKGKSLISVPLIVKDEIIGVINVTSKVKGEKFTNDDLYALMVIATQAAIAIDNSRMYKELENKLKAVTSILEISRAVISSMDLNKVLELIVEKANEIMKTSICSIRLLEEDNETLVLRASIGLSDEYISKVKRIKVGDSVAGIVLKEGKPISVYSIKNEPKYIFTEAAAKEGINSLLCVPIVSKEKIIGVITVYKNEVHNFSDDEINLLSTFAAEVAVAIENAKLYENLNRSYFETIQTLALAIEARDPYTRGHSDRVTQYAIDIAKELGLSEENINAIKYAGKLHDIGKIAVRDEILSKPGPLTPSERAEIKLHPEKGAEIVEPLEFMKGITSYIRYHHERYDGGGYPDGIKKEDIPLIDRILAVADSFDAMTSSRPYRKPLTVEEAISELEKNAGTQFDPTVVSAFKKVLSYKK